MADEGNWYDNFTDESLITDKARTIMSQYKTQEAFNVGGLDAKMEVGKPFKLPKTMADVEHWPDEKDREGFHSAMKELRGGVKSIEDLKGVNFAEGLADARNVNEELVEEFKKFSVEKGYSKQDVQDLAKLNNQIAQKYMNSAKALIEQQEQENTNNVNTGLEALYGGKDAVDSHRENVRKMLQNHCGLSSDEYEEANERLVEMATTQNLVLSKALFNLSENYKEGTTTKPAAPGHETSKQSISERQDKELPVITSHLWPKK